MEYPNEGNSSSGRSPSGALCWLLPGEKFALVGEGVTGLGYRGD